MAAWRSSNWPSMALLHLRVPALDHRDPFPVGTLDFQPEGIGRRRLLLECHPRLDRLAVHPALVQVGPDLGAHRALRDSGHDHAGVVHAIVGVHLLLDAVAQNAEALAWSGRALSLRAADHTEPALEPLAGVRSRDLPGGAHRSRLDLPLTPPPPYEVAETLVLGERLLGWFGLSERGRSARGPDRRKCEHRLERCVHGALLWGMSAKMPLHPPPCQWTLGLHGRCWRRIPHPLPWPMVPIAVKNSRRAGAIGASELATPAVRGHS